MSHINKDRLIANFLDLARIKSPSGEEDQIAGYLINTFKKLGFTVQTDSYGNVIAKLAGSGQPIILCAHMDVAYAGSGKDIKPLVQDGNIIGDGEINIGGDNKDSIAAMIEAFTVFRERDIKTRAAEVVFTKEEEAISRGAKNLDYSLLKGKQCVISDSPDPYGTITLEAPYLYHFDVEVSGNAYNKKEARKGSSAVFIAAEVISNIKIGRFGGEVAINISNLIISSEEVIKDGGKLIADLAKANRDSVSDFGLLFGEVRSIYEDKIIEVLEEIKLLLIDAAELLNGSFKLRQEKKATGYKFSENDLLVKEAMDIFKAQRVTPAFIQTLENIDANIFHENGIKTLVISSAYRHNHSKDEYVIIDDLVRLADFYQRLLEVN